MSNGRKKHFEKTFEVILRVTPRILSFNAIRILWGLDLQETRTPGDFHHVTFVLRKP